MCQQIELRVGEKWPLLSNFKELAALIGADKIVVDQHDYPGLVPDAADESCLCPVDVPATAEKAGYSCRNGWADPRGYSDWIWESPNA